MNNTRRNMKVEARRITHGANKAARELGVTYNYMWRVLSGADESPSLVLKVNRLCPSLFKSPICKINWRKIVRDNERQYEWNGTDYRKRKELCRYRRG